MTIAWIEPDWPAPPGVRAASTLRAGGVSVGPYASLNLGIHVGDDGVRVAENRNRLATVLGLPSEPLWLNQVHGTRTLLAEAQHSAGPSSSPDPAGTGPPQQRHPGGGLPRSGPASADALGTRSSGVVCAVMTADCLPLLLCSRDGAAVAAVHAGWKGLVNGVVESAVTALGTRKLLAWMGPAIGPDAFEVGNEVREIFLRKGLDFAQGFHAAAGDKWRADLYGLARITLQRLGVTEIHGGGWCTFSRADDFFSYRRDGATGRMATLIWRE